MREVSRTGSSSSRAGKAGLGPDPGGGGESYIELHRQSDHIYPKVQTRWSVLNWG